VVLTAFETESIEKLITILKLFKMKNFLYVLLIALSACSPEDDYALLENESSSPAPPESLNLESAPPLNRNSANVFYTETFENPNLDKNPGLSDFYPEFAVDHSFSLDENIKRAENAAGRFEINNDDPKIWSATRSELSQAQSTAKAEGWYGFSQYFPDSYISDSSGEVITQWHDQSDQGETVDRSPSNAIITSDDKFKWMIRWDADAIMNSGTSDGLIYIDLGKIPKNKWVDWVVHIKYSHTNSGILEVWMDGEKVIDRQNMPNAYNDNAYPYLKFGLYKWNWGAATSKRVMYFDEVRIGNSNSSYDEVKPGDSQESVTSEPIPSEPVTPEPIPSEPVTPEPVTSEPIPSEPVTSEPVTSEPVPSEPVTSEPVPSEPVTPEPVPSEPITSEPVTSEPIPSEVVPSEQVTPVNRYRHNRHRQNRYRHNWNRQ